MAEQRHAPEDTRYFFVDPDRGVEYDLTEQQRIATADYSEAKSSNERPAQLVDGDRIVEVARARAIAHAEAHRSRENADMRDMSALATENIILMRSSVHNDIPDLEAHTMAHQDILNGEVPKLEAYQSPTSQSEWGLAA